MSTALVIGLLTLAIAVSALALVLWFRARALASALRSEREGVALLRAGLERHDARAHLLLSVADTLPAAAWTCEGCAQLVELLPDVDQLLTSEGQRRLELARHTQSHHQRIAHDLRQLSQNLNRLHQETQRASVEEIPTNSGEHP